jgi:hypothetical protein
MDKTVLGIVGATVIILGGIVLFAGKSTTNQPQVGDTIEVQPAEHITAGQSHPDYSSNPPTSGWHSANPAPWGAQTEPVADEVAIHNLEHGGIWITYNPSTVDQPTVEQLTNLVRGYRSKVLLSPREAADRPIALASWGRLTKLDTFDEAAITDFIDRNKNKGPEQIPD